ncbi:hypothetical protein [Nocardioides sp.]|uniref:hypothetical protein n=1 Tax=Nocardioides sp. TaxID=35761 RepID=UPI0039E3650F
MPIQDDGAEPAPTLDLGIIEFAGKVRDRAGDILGERFVELWLTDEQDHYLIGVLDLRQAEIVDLTAELDDYAPIELVDRQVSRQQLDDVAAEVTETIEQRGTIGEENTAGLQLSVNYERGIVTVTTSEQDAAGLAVDLETATGLRPRTGSHLGSPRPVHPAAP